MTHTDPEKSKEHAVGMAVFQLHSAMAAVSEMARSPEYRDHLVNNLGRISEVALSINLVWSMLKQREAA